jgi:hypothetical protein
MIVRAPTSRQRLRVVGVFRRTRPVCGLKVQVEIPGPDYVFAGYVLLIWHAAGT